MIRAAQILLTATAIQFGFIPLLADLNASHLFHEGWLPHARFHTAWAITVGAGLAAYVLFLLWGPGKDRLTRVRYASAPGCIFFSAFFVAYFFSDAFGGGLADVPNLNTFFGVNGNLFAFSIAIIVQGIATALAFTAKDS